MKMYGKGFRFEVVNNGLYGIINSFYYDPLARRKMYSISYYEIDNGRHFMTASVFPETLDINLKRGTYKEF